MQPSVRRSEELKEWVRVAADVGAMEVILHQQRAGRGPSPRDSERGAAVVEFALVSVLFLTFLYGIVTYGVVFLVKHDLAHAAAQGARASLGAGDAVDAADDAVTRAVAAMPQTFRDHLVRNIPAPAPCLHEPATDCITVTLTYPYAAHPVIPALPFVGAAIPDTLTATSVVALS